MVFVSRVRCSSPYITTAVFLLLQPLLVLFRLSALLLRIYVRLLPRRGLSLQLRILISELRVRPEPLTLVVTAGDLAHQ